MRFLVVSVLALCLTAANAQAKDKLTVLLDWFINPDHGPLIVAQEKGFFEAAGLEVELVEPADPSAPPKLVAAGQADLAVSYQPQLHVQVAEGLPLVRIATLVATPLNALVVLEDGPIRSIADLKGKKVGFSVGGFEDVLLGTMLQHHGLKIDDVDLINVNFSLSPSLISGQVDAVIGAFRNFELNQMDIVERPGRAFFVEEEGVPSYDELIVVAKAGSDRTDVYRRFIDAVEAANRLCDQPPAGKLGNLQRDGRQTGRRIEPPRLARHAAAFRPASGCAGHQPVRTVCALPVRVRHDRESSGARHLCRRTGRELGRCSTP